MQRQTITKRKPKSFILLLLLLIFAAPGFLAYLFFTHPHWLGQAGINRGKLLSPPLPFVKLSEQTKWRLILWYPSSCHQDCLKALDKLARIRLALGRQLYNVEQWLIVKEGVELSNPIQKNLQDKGIGFLPLSLKKTKQLKLVNSQIFIVNPQNYLILKYRLTVDSEAVFHDLKHLLKVDKQNG